MIANSNERQCEEGSHGTNVADPEETLVVVMERCVLRLGNNTWMNYERRLLSNKAYTYVVHSVVDVHATNLVSSRVASTSENGGGGATCDDGSGG